MRKALLGTLGAGLACISFSASSFALEEPVAVGEEVGKFKPLKESFDVFGRSIFSKYNATDLVDPYDGVDSFMVLKYSLFPWNDGLEGVEHRFGPYLEVIPAHSTSGAFWFQRYVQAGAGVQWYPFKYPGRAEGDDDAVTTGKRPPLGGFAGLRLFTLLSAREYYDQPDDSTIEDQDVQVGLDFYHDDLTEYRKSDDWVAESYLSLSYRDTNYALKDYGAVAFNGLTSYGYRLEAGNVIVIPYATVQWSVVPDHDDRWWENYLRGGGGVRVYPLFHHLTRKYQENASFLSQAGERLNLFVEAVTTAGWLGDDPPDSVKDEDFRVGISYSTRGIFGVP